MKKTHSTSKKLKTSKPDFDQALRACEAAASRVKEASEELSVCWTALGIEIANGAEPTQLLRRRAWCNVLELRLKEKTALLEESRRGIDSAWNDLMRDARQRHVKRRDTDVAIENLFSNSWSLLLHPKHFAPAKAQARL